MSSKTLSAVIEKHIRRLCLNDFPCGYGSWRKAKDSTQGAETEDTDALLDLLRCPHSPWMSDESWSPQAPALRQLAVLTPKRLHAAFIYNYFTSLRIMDEDVSVVDGGLLKFAKLEELVLSANKISEIPAENLPSTLKILELCANRMSALNSLTSHPPPHLRYLGLGSNSLGSHEDISYLTGRHWPQLMCLDLSDCEFEDHRALLSALGTLPRLRTLVLEGNPLALASCYPGLTVDSLPMLSYLDGSWVSPEERHHFRGLAKISDLIVEQASVTVRVGRLTGIQHPPMSVDENTPEFPVVTYRYFITYEFPNQTSTNLKSDSESKSDAAATGHETGDDSVLQSNTACEKETSKPDSCDLKQHTEDSCRDVSRHSTLKLSSSRCIDFSDTQTYMVSDLRRLKRFLNHGLHLRVEEEKVLSWPAVSKDITVAKPSQTIKEKKGRKGKESPIKSGSTKDKSRDKKKKPAAELVEDAPIRRILGSVHVPLQNLLRGDQKVDVLCDLSALHTQPEVEATQTLDKDVGKKIKEDKKKDEKDSRRRGNSGTGQKNTATSKGKEEEEKESESDDLTDHSLELRVELERWRSASEARQFQLTYGGNVGSRN